jgi:Na+/melibiose symporter-like transporter
VGLSLRSSTMLYYFRYCAGNESLFSMFNIIGLGSLIVGVMCSTAGVKRYGSRNLFIAGLFLCAVMAGLLIVVPPGATAVIFTLEAFRQFAWGLTAPLLWAMMADVADFSEWKTGRRATAMVFAATVFGLKAGLSIGRSIASWLLSLFGYVPNAVQTPESLLGIKLIASVITGVVFVLGVACLFFYKIDAKTNIQMAAELAERRKKYA